ncbi:MAG: response regulator transcription factor [Cyanobacteria bacterium SZAS-4]|nr:response regulator transcription factor [Cyanobacteria bacterium SZAS-4]
MSKLLLVEDDVNLVTMVAEFLRSEHHVVEVVHDGEMARDLLKTYVYELVILDLGLPDISGLTVLKDYRSRGGSAKILILTGKDKIEEKEEGLDAGADDYLTKPFHVRELLARVRALLRRPEQTFNDELKAASLILYPRDHKVEKNGKPLNLSPREFALLEFFMRHPNQLFNADALLDRVWQSDSEASADTIKVTINRLRSKIGTDSHSPVITTVFGHGYKLDLPTEN